MKKSKGIVWIVLLLFVVGCADQQPRAESDSRQSYNSESRIPVDDNIYRLVGTVADIEQFSRQVAPGSGYISGSDGYVSGQFVGAVIDGKTFLRLLIESIEPETDLVQVGNVAIIKATDTKATILIPGDRVTLLCRAQFEAIAAVRENETFDETKGGTWEFDYCRLETPKVEPTTGR